ncbi:MAG: serine/threonine-protein kinase [Oligoflexales bacterium]
MFLRTLCPALALTLQSFQPTLCAPGEEFFDFYIKETTPLHTTKNSSVFLCTHKKTGHQKILKEFFLKSYDKNPDHELQMMHLLQQKPHPHLIHLEDEFITNSLRRFIFKRYTRDLFDQIFSSPLTSSQQKNIFFNIASAVAHLHRNEVAHRDISLENILINRDLEGCLCDLGAASYKEDMTSTFCGKRNYAAPEVFHSLKYRTPYDPYSADIWSLGITFYVAAFQNFLFDEANNQSLDFKIFKEALYPEKFIKEKESENIDPLFLDLLVKMLRINPEERIDIEGVLIHKWFSHEEGSLKL